MQKYPFKSTVFWGDSLVRGVCYDERRGRYAISKCTAAATFSERSGIQVTNRAHMGMTAVKGEEQMLRDLAHGIRAESALIAFGGNDSDFNWQAVNDDPTADHRPNTELPLFTETLRRMVKTVTAHGIRAVLCTLPPVLSERYLTFLLRRGLERERLLSFLGTPERITRFHEQYSRAVEGVAAECGTLLVDVRAAFFAHGDLGALYSVDGIHPSDEGQRVYAEAMLAALAS